MAVRHLRRGLVSALALLLAVGTAPGAAHADDIRNQQWHLKALNVAEAHKISQGSGVTVAVIDSGVTKNHPDLKRNVLKGWDAVTGGDGDGWGDLDGHGTGMAGLIAAHGHGPGGRDGALGIAPMAKILPIRLETKLGAGDAEALGNAVEYAVARGATIISVSYVGGGMTETAQKQIFTALESGVIIVVSIGNRSQTALARYPATESGVVAVGAVDRDAKHGGISIESPVLQLVAPGKSIASTGKLTNSSDTGYRIGTGSSPSAAIVAGAAALVWSRFPELSSAEVINRLTYTARDLGDDGRDYQYGFGQIDLVRALTEPNVPPPNPWPWPLPSPGAASVPPTIGPTSALAAPMEDGDSGSGSTARTFLVIGLCLLLVAGIVAILVRYAVRRRARK